jgi:xanthine dehydrogenase molybdopterin-binding subunit B
MFVIEHIIDRIAQVVGKTTEEVRLLNFINDGT